GDGHAHAGAARGGWLHPTLRSADRGARHESSGGGFRTVHALICWRPGTGGMSSQEGKRVAPSGRTNPQNIPRERGLTPLMEREILERAPPPADRRIAYGDGAWHFGDLRVPSGTPRGAVIVLHGGFWRA